MRTNIDITDGIAVKLLLAGIVLTSAMVGTLGLAGTAPVASADGVTQDAGVQFAFPIDNVTAFEAASGSPVALTYFAQDMEPYALPQDMDPY